MAEGVLPPAIQAFVANAEQWIAGIDEMIAADERLLASIEQVQAAAREAGLAADEAAGADAAGAEAGAAAGAGADSAEAAAAEADASTAAAAATGELADAQARGAETAQAEAAAQAEVADTAAGAIGPVSGMRDAVAAAGEASVVASGQIRVFTAEDLQAAETAQLVAGAMEAQARAAGIQAEVLASGLGEIAGAIAVASEQSGLYVDAMGRMRQANGAVVSSVAAVRDALAGESDSAGLTAEEVRLLQVATQLAAETDAQLAAGAQLATDALGVEARAAGLNADAEKALAASNEEAGASAAEGAGKFKMLGLAAAIGIAASVKLAGDFQQQMTRLVTSAGESEKNIGMISKGILDLSVSTNTSAKQLGAGMYYVESAGFHGAAGLAVLRAAAQGAQAEGANMVDTSDALTTALDDYGMTSTKAGLQQHYANQMMDEMVTAVSRGKMTLQAFASSLSMVLPVAHKAGLSFAQVAGAEATMTAQGMSARQASQDLRHVIMSLQNPTNVQSTEMGQLGVNSTKLAANLGRAGLTGTLDTLSGAILHNMGPSGLVMLKAFNQSQLAAQSAKAMIAAMPPSIQKTAEAYQQGALSAKQWNQIMFQGSIPAKFKNLLQQFATVSNKANGFNDVLKAGGGAAQTYSAAMAKMTGGITGVQVAEMLGGKSAITFGDNVRAIGDAADHTGKNVQNWGLIQKNFNFQLGSAEKSVQAVAISLGMALLPAVTRVMRGLTSFAGMLARNAIAVKGLAVLIGAVLAVVLERNLAKGVLGASKALKNLGGDVKAVGGFFRAGAGDVSWFGRILNGFGVIGQSVWNTMQSAWSGLTGLFSRSKDAIEAQAGAQDAQALSADGVAASEEAAGAAALAETAGLEASTVASEEAAVAATELDVALDANPIGAIILLILALVAVFVELWKHCTGFRDFWKGLWRDISGYVAASWHRLEAVLHAIGAAFDWLKNKAAPVIDWLKSHWALLAGILGGPIGGAVAYIISHWRKVKPIFEDVFNWIKSHWPLLLSILGGPIGAAVAAILKHWRGFRDAVETIWGAIKTATVDTWQAIDSTVFRPMGTVLAAQARYWKMLSDHVGQAWSVIKQVTVDTWHVIDSAVIHPIEDAITAQMHYWGELADAVGHACSDIKNWMTNVEAFVVRIFGDIAEAAGQLQAKVDDAFGRLVSGAWSHLTGLLDDVRHIGYEILSFAASLGSQLFSDGAHMIEQLAAGISSAAGSVIGAVGHILSLGIGDLIPHSPAKSGPLSGDGDPRIGGQRIIQRLVEGIRSEGALPGAALTDALRGLGFASNGRLALTGALSGAASAGGAGAAAGGPAALNVRVDLSNALSSPQWQQGLQRTIQQAVLDYALRNSGSGLILPQRTV